MRNLIQFFSIVVLPSVLACSAREQTRSESVGLAKPVTTTGGGQLDPRPRVFITGPLRGASSVDPLARINLTVSCPRGGPCAVAPGATLALIAGKIRFRNVQTGATVGVTVDPTIRNAIGGKSLSPTMNEYSGSLVASVPLTADTNYALDLQSDTDAVLGVPDSTTAEAQAALDSTATPFVQSISLYTGSAPMINRVELSNDPQKPITSLRIRFSEPVQLASLVNSGFGWRSGVGVARGCVWSAAQQACASGTSTEVTELFDVMFPSAMTAAEIKGGRINLPGSIIGSARTVAEAAITKGVAKGSVASVAPIAVSLADVAWAPCSASGDVLCVRDLAIW